MDIERCKVYSIWSNMKKRCFNEDYKKMHPTYQGVDLCSEWDVF